MPYWIYRKGNALALMKLLTLAATALVAFAAAPTQAKPCYSTVVPGSPAAFKCVTNRGLLTSQERLLLNPNSNLRGPAIKAIPGESRLSFNRRLAAARKEWRKQFAR